MRRLGLRIVLQVDYRSDREPKMLDRSHRTESNDSIQPLSRAMIGGVQPKYGWWAPVAVLYIKRWGPGHTIRGSSMLPVAPQIFQSDLGLALVTGSSAATTHPRSRHHPSPWPVARVPQAMEQVISLCDLLLSLRYIRSYTDKALPSFGLA
jgi:hypothetical protein